MVVHPALVGFRTNTPTELDDALIRLRDRGLRALILDLRGNTGGLFSAGVQVAQRFIPSWIIARVVPAPDGMP